jgi:hydrogenase expression/formation protein HypC
MCLAVPAKIIRIKHNAAEIDAGGIIKSADIRMLKGLKTGDYVLVHAGFAIQKLSPGEAKETLSLLEEMSE